MKKLRTWREYLIEKFTADKEEAIGYLQAIIEDYQTFGDIRVVLLALRTVTEAQGGIAVLSEKTGIEPETLSEILASDNAPQLDTFRTILIALGAQLSIEPVKDESFNLEFTSQKSTRINTTLEKSA